MGWLGLVMGWSWVAHGLAMGWPWVGHGLVMGWSWVGHGLAMGWSWVGHGLVMGWPWVGHGRPWVRHGLGVGHGMAKWVGYVGRCCHRPIALLRIKPHAACSRIKPQCPPPRRLHRTFMPVLRRPESSCRRQHRQTCGLPHGTWAWQMQMRAQPGEIGQDFPPK